MKVTEGRFIKVSFDVTGKKYTGKAALVITRGDNGSVVTEWENSRGEVTTITASAALRKIRDGYTTPAGAAATETLTFDD